MIEDPLPLKKARGFAHKLYKQYKKKRKSFVNKLQNHRTKKQKFIHSIIDTTQKQLALGGVIVVIMVVFGAVYGENHVPITAYAHDASMQDSLRSDMTMSIDIAQVATQEGVFGHIYREFTYIDMQSDVDHELEQDLYSMVGEHPIKEMVPFIAKHDRKVAAFIVGIAKKESNWGKHSPSTYANACYNFWGYRGAGSLGKTQSGYGCFATPEEAIDVVGGRIHKLAIEYQRDTPAEMIIWKCGNSCSGHSPESVSKWIQDVDIYYSKIVAFAY